MGGQRQRGKTHSNDAADRLLQAIARRFPVAALAEDCDDNMPRTMLEAEKMFPVWRSMLASMDRLGFVRRAARGENVEKLVDAWCPASVLQ
jgi:hypothetical protein